MNKPATTDWIAIFVIAAAAAAVAIASSLWQTADNVRLFYALRAVPWLMLIGYYIAKAVKNRRGA